MNPMKVSTGSVRQATLLQNRLTLWFGGTWEVTTDEEGEVTLSSVNIPVDEQQRVSDFLTGWFDCFVETERK